MTATALYSNSWHRVSAAAAPALAHPHPAPHLSGQVWYVMQDQSNGEFHRYTPEANLLISLMDGRRSVQQIWEIACAQLDDDAMPQDEVIRLMSQLHRADVLMTDRAPDVRDLVQRRRRQRAQKIKQYVGNPSALKLPLLDPDRWLSAALPYYRWLFTWVGGLLWLAVVLYGAALGAMHWKALTHNVWDQVFSAGNVLAMALVYPLVKAVHELGHACAVKARGGEVHEIGLMFLLLVPIPYVDASAAAGFADKRWRMLVGAAGILVELFLAALAMIAWTQLEPGLGRSVAYNVIILCGVSTLFMNGNPLLRYDGYYVLSDAIEIPNLGQRANAWLGYLFKRYVLGLAAVEAPRASRGEQWWFVGYALLSFVYRMFIMFLAIFLVAGSSFLRRPAGLLGHPEHHCHAAVAAGAAAVHRPADPGAPGRSYAITALCVLAAAGLAGAVPMPSSTDTEGVVWCRRRPRCARRWPASSASARRRTMRSWRRRALLALENDELQRRDAMLAAQVDEYRRATCRRMPRIRCRPPSRAINGRAC